MGAQQRDPARVVQMRVESLTRQLNLTESQQSVATALFTQAQTTGESIQSNLQEARHSLTEAIKNYNIAEIDTLSITIGTLTGQLTAIDGKAQAAFYAVLSADQQEKFDLMPRGGQGGPGGPMGPGGFGPPPDAGPRN
jgi:hypothetical protein